MPNKSQPTGPSPPAPTNRLNRTSPAARIALSALLVAALANAALLAIRRSGGQTASTAITHVHGLGINPADRGLHVAGATPDEHPAIQLPLDEARAWQLLYQSPG